MGSMVSVLASSGEMMLNIADGEHYRYAEKPYSRVSGEALSGSRKVKEERKEDDYGYGGE